MEKLIYKGYEINAAPYQLAENNRWTINIHIWKKRGYEAVERPFSAGNTYETKEEAIQHCLNYGKQIIDGQVEGCSVDDL